MAEIMNKTLRTVFALAGITFSVLAYKLSMLTAAIIADLTTLAYHYPKIASIIIGIGVYLLL